MDDKIWEWLADGHSPQVGGRATDITQIGYTLNYEVRSAFPINDVPAPVVEALERTERALEQAESEMEKLADLVVQHLEVRR